MKDYEFELARSKDQNLTFQYLGACFRNISDKHIQALRYPASASIEYEYRQDVDLPISDKLMEGLKIIDGDGAYTNLGLLVSDQCPHTMQLEVFDGLDETAELLDSWELSGSVARHFVRAERVLDTYNGRAALVVDGRGVTYVDHPHDALWEALLNAVVHRDYSIKNASTLIRIFEDHIEFANAGGLVEGVTCEELFDRRPVIAPRNPYLAEVFYRLRAFKNYGGGIARMMDSYLEQPNSPIYDRMSKPVQVEATKKAFKLTLFNANERTGMKRVSERGYV